MFCIPHLYNLLQSGSRKQHKYTSIHEDPGLRIEAWELRIEYWGPGDSPYTISYSLWNQKNPKKLTKSSSAASTTCAGQINTIQDDPSNFQVAEFEAMVESVPTVFIMSFALAVTGGKGVITEESCQNLFSPEVLFSINFFYWLFLQSKNWRCYFSSSPFWHRLPRQLWGWSNH